LQAQADEIRARIAREERASALETELQEQEATARQRTLEEREAVKRKVLEVGGYCVLFVWSLAMIAIAYGLARHLIAKGEASRPGQAGGRARPVPPSAPPPAPAVPRGKRSAPATGALHIQPTQVSGYQLSYDGFLAFCVDHLLPTGRGVPPLDDARWNESTQHFPFGISREMARVYMSVLQRAHVLTAQDGEAAGWRLRRHIGALEDIGQRIPRTAFERRFHGESGLGFTVERALAGSRTRGSVN
jgi:hypothetical protein